jgi:hypothetical protein
MAALLITLLGSPAVMLVLLAAERFEAWLLRDWTPGD